MPNSPSSLENPARPSVEAASDPELLALPTPPRRARTIALVLMSSATILALAMMWTLRGEFRYALASTSPKHLGDLAQLSPGPELTDSFVHGTAKLGPGDPISYERFLEPDAFRVAQVEGNERLWIELRIPSATSGTPQTSFVGRLVPLASAGIQYRGLPARIGEHAPGREIWLLVEGATPASSRWAVALTLALAIFSGWNLTQLVRLVRRVRE